MTAKPWTVVVVQALVLVGVGSAIAVIDAVRRPVNLTRAEVDINQVLNQAGNSAPAPATPKADTPPVAPPPAPTTPAPAAGTLKPGDAGWQPTPESALPKGQITIDQARKLFDAGAQFIDTRKKDEYEAGHIQNAFRIGLSNFQKGDPPLLGMIPRDSIVVCYCNGGHCDESEAVARMFAGSGYSKVFVLHDGFPGWKAMGHPVQTGTGMSAE